MDKNILITGCSKGLGIGICKALLDSGYTVYGISRTNTEELNQLKLKYPGRLNHLIFDLKEVELIKQKIFQEWISNKIPLLGFINNAAVAYDDIITNLNYKPLKNMFETNVFSPFLITKYVIRNMIFNRIKGSIIHISSISVHTGYKGLAMYAASKGALEAFSKNTGREWGERGIRSNCIVGGFMETNMSSSLTEELKDRIYKRTSLKVPTSIDSVSNTAVFLLSEGACSITGQNIFVDSGTI